MLSKVFTERKWEVWWNTAQHETHFNRKFGEKIKLSVAKQLFP